MKVEGYGYEFDAKYIGGPADGLETNVVAVNFKTPPEISCIEVNSYIKSKMSIGRHFLKRRIPTSARVGVYKIDANTHGDEEELTYLFVETMTYGDYLRKYGDE